MLSLAGGEAWTITDLPKGASGLAWAPDSKRIAFLSSTTSEDIEKARHNKDSAKSKETRKLEATEDSAGAPTTGAGEGTRIRRPHHAISTARYEVQDKHQDCDQHLE